jgi:hypothetical protein
MRGGAMTMASAKMADKERQAEVRGGRPCAVDGQRVQAVYRQRTTDRRRLYAEADAWDMFMFMFMFTSMVADTACSSKCRAHPFSPGQPLVQGEQGAWSREPSRCSSASRNACTGCPPSQRPRTHRLMVLILHGGGSAARRARPTDNRWWPGGVAAITTTTTTTTTAPRRMAMGPSLCSAPYQRRIAASPHRRPFSHSPSPVKPEYEGPGVPSLLLRPVCARFRRAHVAHGTLIAQPRRQTPTGSHGSHHIMRSPLQLALPLTFQLPHTATRSKTLQPHYTHTHLHQQSTMPSIHD